MSTTVGQYGTASSALLLSAGIKQMTLEQETLAWETSADTLSETYAGLGATRSTAISVTPKITQVTAWQSNITNSQTNLTVSATSLNQIVSIAQKLATNLLTIGGTTETTGPTAIATESASDLDSLKSVLNVSGSSGYVFSGTDSNTPPIPGSGALSASPLAQTIAGLVAGLDTGSSPTSVMEQATAAASPANTTYSIFSASLSVAPTDASKLQNVVATGTDNLTAVGITATQNSTTSAASSTSTGSPIADLARDLMIASSMSGMDSSTSGFSDLVNQLHSSLETTIGQLTELESTVGVTQDSLTTQSTLLTSVQKSLTTQLGNARDADLATVATENSQLSSQLQASYILVSDMKNMTLANYI